MFRLVNAVLYPYLIEISDKIPNTLLTCKQQQCLENDDDTYILSPDRLSGCKLPVTTPK